MNRGFAWLIFFMLLSAIRLVYLAELLERVNTALLLLGCFGLVTLLFLVHRVLVDRSVGRLLARACTVWPDLLALNLTTAVVWAGHFFALSSGLEPVVYGGIANAGQPVATVFLASMISCHCRITRSDVLVSVGVLAGIVWLAVTTWSGRSAVGSISPGAAMAGIGLSVATAIGMAGTTVFVTRLHARGIETTEAMALRFIALLVMSAALMPSNAWSVSPPGLTGHIVVLGLLGFALPLFCYQRGVEAVDDPQIVSLLLATLPILQLLMQFFDPRLHFSLNSLLGILVTVGFSILGITLRIYNRPAANGLSPPQAEAVLNAKDFAD